MVIASSLSRNGYVFRLRFGDKPLFLRVEEDSLGRPVALYFDDVGSSGSTISKSLTRKAWVATLLLRRGTDLDKITSRLRGVKDAQPVKGHEHIQEADSMEDLISRVLALEYRGNTTRSHVDKSRVNITYLRGYTSGAFRSYGIDHLV